MKLNDFDFDLPEELIATRPVHPRSAARLLHAEGGAITDRHVRDLPAILRRGDLLVINDTRVIAAQLAGERRRASADGSGRARVEITLMAPAPDGSWRVMARPLRKLAEGDQLHFAGGLEAVVLARRDDDALLRFNRTGAEFDAALAQAGQMPLPPYIARRRAPDARDLSDYQPVWARHAGSVAAPTASLHFDAALIEALRAAGVGFAEVTLHVGAGTFLPVKTEDIAAHRMHAEWGAVSADAAEKINATRRAGARVIAVGTTALRLIESAAGADGSMRPWQGETDIFIRPGYRFAVTDGLITNFHLPRSTLLMLVSALMGVETVRRIYAHAVRARYRFFSYGDASLLIPPQAE
ncbi:MAG: tRNA preQ1(34) S-adenosylmethionine ribosyltransferase-isomerase QueA [Pararhodobacter sp.]|nr:tRNA preQ1(34) S-adenosylmethionine ribosyltransferase-isomerase QueA [Pararhodobacter sp.]